MEQKEFITTLLAFTSDHGIAFSELQASKCFDHLRLMIEWNRRLNLTRITEPGEVLVKHFLDSLIPSRWLPERGFALDVGTGPGFPGIPLKVLRPALHMVLLEAHRKKVSFLKVLLSQLGLEGIAAEQGRAEAFPPAHHPLAQVKFALITLRAVLLEAEHLAVCGSKLLEPGGTVAWWAGPTGEERTESLAGPAEEAGLVFERAYAYTLPLLSAPRHLLVWKKRS